MGTKITKTVQPGKPDTFEAENVEVEGVNENSPRLGVSVTVNLGNYQSLKLTSSRSGEDSAEVSAKLIEDLKVLRKDFLASHKELV